MTISLANVLNKSEPKFTFNIPESHQFVKPAELVETHGVEQVYKVMGMYVNTKGKYGDEPVLILDNCLLNAPAHLLDAVRNILDNEQYIELVNKGRVGVKFYQYKNQYGVQYGVQWVDL